MVHFTQSCSRALFDSCSSGDTLSRTGLLHSDIRESMDMCSSSRLFAAYHVLLRLAAPQASPADPSFACPYYLFSFPAPLLLPPLPPLLPSSMQQFLTRISFKPSCTRPSPPYTAFSFLHYSLFKELLSACAFQHHAALTGTG